MHAGVDFEVLVHDGETIYVIVKTKLLEVLGSAWKSSLKTAKKPRLNRTQTAQDRKFPGPSKTATTVRSSVPQDFGNFKTDKRPV